MNTEKYQELINNESTSLTEVFYLIGKASYRNELYTQIFKRKDWQALDLNKQTEFAKKSNYNPLIVFHIITRDDCPLPEAWELSQKTDFTLYILSGITKHSEWPSLSTDEKKEYAKKCAYLHHIVSNIIENKNCSLDDALDLAKSSGFDWAVMETLVKKESWKKIKLRELLDMASKQEYHPVVMSYIIGNHDLDAKKISFLLAKTNYHWYAVWARVKMLECTIAEALNLITQSDLSWKVLESLTNKPQWKKLAIENQIELADKIGFKWCSNKQKICEPKFCCQNHFEGHLN